MAEDIRWKQRFSNFKKVLARMTEAIEKGQNTPLSMLEEQGLIKAFEFTYELVWNVIKDFYEYQGDSGIMGSRDAFRLAFRRGLTEDGEVWMEMIKSRNETSHTYDEEVKDRVVKAVCELYYPEFLNLQAKLDELCASD